MTIVYTVIKSDIVPVMLILVLVIASLVLVLVLAGPVLDEVLFLNLACVTHSIVLVVIYLQSCCEFSLCVLFIVVA